MLSKQYFLFKKETESNSFSIWQSIAEKTIFLPIISIFLITFLLVTPQGEFPLNDDWIHAKAVQRLLEEGHYRGHPYVAATLIAQAYWGAFFCKIWGFSFTSLRMSTLVLAVIAAWAVARSALILGVKRNLALLCSILFAFNPIILNLSYSFMTDVPFLSLSALSGLCFLGFFRQYNVYLVGLGSSLAVIGFFIRQFAIVLPVAFMLTLAVLVWHGKYRVKWSTMAALTGPWAAGTVLYFWLLSVKESGTPLLIEGRTIPVMAIEAIRHYPVALCYMGLFALPLGAGLIWQIKQKDFPWNQQKSLVLAATSSISLSIFALPSFLNDLREMRSGRRADWLDLYRARLPLLTHDYLKDLAIGNPQLPDQYPHPLIHLQQGWWILTIAALITVGLFWIVSYPLLQRVWNARLQLVQIPAADTQRLFLLIWLLLALTVVYNPWRLTVFDRLLLGGLEPFLLLLAHGMNQYRHQIATRIAAVGTVLLCTFSVMSVQDYLAWNRATWQAQDKLMQTYHVSSKSIRGVDAFNGWYNSDQYMQVHHTRDFWQANLTGRGPWTFDDAYVVTSQDSLKGYQPFEKFAYFTWLGMQNRSIIIFKRDNSQNGKMDLPQDQPHSRSSNNCFSTTEHP